MGGRAKGQGGKGFVEEDWRTAYSIIFNNGIFPYLETEDSDFILTSQHNPEKELIKKDLIQNLSAEAKDVISLIFKSPIEVLKDLMPSKYTGETSETGVKYSKEKIRYRLISNGWKAKKVDRAFQEIRSLVRELETV
jgi:hypothetical protein